MSHSNSVRVLLFEPIIQFRFGTVIPLLPMVVNHVLVRFHVVP
jgi:hypothetical protein